MRISLAVAAFLISAGLVGPAAAEAGDREGNRRGFPGRNNRPTPSSESKPRGSAFSAFNRSSGPTLDRPTIRRPHFEAPTITRQSPMVRQGLPQPRNQGSDGWAGALRSRFSGGQASGGQNGNRGGLGDVFGRARTQPSTPQVTLPTPTSPGLATSNGVGLGADRGRAALDRLRQRFPGRFGDSSGNGSQVLGGSVGATTPQPSAPASPLLGDRFAGRRQGTPPSSMGDTTQALGGNRTARRFFGTQGGGTPAGGTSSPLVTDRSGLATDRVRDARSRIFGGTTGVRRGGTSGTGGTIVAPGTSGGSTSLLGPRAGIRRYHSHSHRSYLRRGLDGGFFFWGGTSFGYPFHHRYYDDCFGPAFGFGLVYYAPIYTPWIVPVIESPTVIVVEQEPIWIVEEPGPSYGPPLVPPAGEPTAPIPAPTEIPAPGAFPPPAPEPETPAAPEEVPGAEAPASNPTFDAGVQAFLAGDYEAACAKFRDVTASEPEHGEAWLALVQANFALMRYDEAAKALAKAANLGAFPRGYRFDPRPLYAKTEGAFLAAFTRLKERVRTQPEDVDARLVLAYLHVSLGERAEAHAQIDEILRLRPTDETAPILTLALLPPLPPQTGSPGMDGR